MACELGADAVGFVIEPTSPRAVTLARARELALLALPFATPVLVQLNCIVESDWPGLLQGTSFPLGDQTRRILTGHPTELRVAEGHWAALLVDAAKDGVFGGTGLLADWDEAAELVRLAKRPVILAGGLTPDNVQDAIRKVQPYAVDVASGTEAGKGVKDPVKLREFILAAKNA
ncbi:MAG: phosphoribosylanthranilate isomerase [Armatimonadetes bacterium]|nr:phosphoribosylanthranilate isomerase [Armatimonadota bacterium]